MVFYPLSYTTTFIRFFQVRKLLLFIAVFLTVGVNAQTYLMQNGTLNVCSGTFYDTGGSFGLYGANENLTMTFCAPVGQNVVLNFTSFGLSTALGGDYLTIYDGPTTASPQIPGSPFTGTVGPGQIFSTSGCFTLVFTSNFAAQNIGWVATIDCVSPPSCDDGYQNQGETDVDCGGPCPGLCYNNPGGTINACEGAFFDTGGSGGDYGNNENIVTTFCSPVAGQQILFDFTSFVLYGGDYLTIYDGPTTGSPMIGSYTQNNLNGLVTSTSGCLTFEFTSDGFLPNSGWVSRFSCYVPSCNDSILNQGECGVDCGGPCPQCLSCDNIGFESGDFTGWTGTTGVTNMSTAPAAYPDYVGNSTDLPSDQHTIMTGAGTDFCGGFPVVSPMGNYSVLLGDGRYIGSKGATIEKTFGVTALNPIFSYWYAVVLQDPGHSPQEQPFFKVELFDCSNSDLNCGQFIVVAAPGVPGFNSTNTCGIPSAPVYYKDWTRVNIDMTNFIGSNITAKFSVGDCSESGHFAYAYIDATCPMSSVDTLCALSPVVLPIELKTFRASCLDGQIITEWETSTEINNDYFTIEYSKNAIDWDVLAIVNGAGNSNVTTQYSHISDQYVNDVKYLRLLQTDYDGNTTYSKMISINCDEEGPVFSVNYKGNLSPYFTLNTKSHSKITLIDMCGRVIYKWNYNAGIYNTHLPKLAAGTYLLLLNSNTKNIAEKVIVNN